MLSPPLALNYCYNDLMFFPLFYFQGCIELLDRSGVEIEGKSAVVLGRSNIVGIPVALLLMQRNATVTIAHSRTRDLEAVIRGAGGEKRRNEGEMREE